MSIARVNSIAGSSVPYADISMTSYASERFDSTAGQMVYNVTNSLIDSKANVKVYLNDTEISTWSWTGNKQITLTSVTIVLGDIVRVFLLPGDGIFKKNLPFKNAFASSEQTITLGGLLTIAHGLGAVPTLFTPQLICKTADNGWAVNDVIQQGVSGIVMYADATNVYVRFSNTSIPSLNKTTGATVSLTPASWRLIMKAYL